jgi:hypothetical protein
MCRTDCARLFGAKRYGNEQKKLFVFIAFISNEKLDHNHHQQRIIFDKIVLVLTLGLCSTSVNLIDASMLGYF